jgi:hypothetical protein
MLVQHVNDGPFHLVAENLDLDLGVDHVPKEKACDRQGQHNDRATAQRLPGFDV